MSYEEVVRQYSKTVYETAYLYFRNRETAEDITQEVFLSYFHKAEQFRGEASLKTYLIKVTFNKCHDYQMSWKNKTHFWIEKFILKDEHQVETTILKNESKQMLLDQIEKLKPKYKEVVILYYFHEYFIKEISEILKLPENTVHTRLKRAKEKLKWQLLEEGSFYEETIIRRNS